MSIVARVADAMQTVLTTTAEELARRSGLIQRERELTGPQFVQGLVFGWLDNPQATLEGLCQSLAAVGVSISPQGLDQRFSPPAAGFLRGVLEAACQEVIQAEATTVEVLGRFEGVLIDDSTQVRLPAMLASEWEGCTGASLKLQVRWDLQRGGLVQMQLQPGREHDQRGALQRTLVPEGGLRLHDLGYLDLEQLERQDQAGRYFLCRPKANCGVEDEAGQRFELDAFLYQHRDVDQIDVPIRLGSTQKVACRLLAWRVPEKVAAERRRKLKAHARRKQQPVSQRQLALCDWFVLVTNCPVTLLSPDEALVLARWRWQIELLFKAWKSQALIDEWRSDKPWRILCEVYAKLIGALIRHWIWITGTWSCPQRSLFKAGTTFKQQALHLAITFTQGCRQLIRAIRKLHHCLQAGCRINRSRKDPRAFQLLLDLEQQPQESLT